MENQNVTQLIEKLASKLGTTTEYLWSVLVKQAYVSSIIDIVVSIVLVVISYLVIKGILKAYKKEQEECSRSSYYSSMDNPLFMLGCIFGGIFILVSGFIILVNIGNIITGLTNPEYWALNKVLSVFR